MNLELTHLSYSSINTYLLCPRAYQYKYIEKPPVKTSPALVFGSVFHQAVEGHIQHKADGVSLHRRWFSLWDQAMEEEMDDVAWDKEPFEYEELGAVMLASNDAVDIIESIKPLVHEGKLAIETKIEFEVPGVPVPVIGYIDLIEEDGTPADFKTSARQWSQSRADKELQPQFYLAALEQMEYTVSDEFRYYIFIKSAKKPQVQVLTTRRSQADIEWMFGLVQGTWEAIEKGVFPPNPSTWICSPRWCSYWDHCRGGNKKIRFK